MLLILSFIFWAVSDYAAAYGRTHAKEMEGKLDEHSSVTVYSARRLSIDDSGDSGSGSGVHEDSLPESDGAYRYRYQGLRDSDTIRVEIRRGTQR